MNISIKSIPHEEHRYDTVGDYGGSIDDAWFEISKMKDWRYEILVAVHELIEYALVTHRKIPIEDIDAFDKEFEKNRKPGDVSEPGDAPDAPYRKEHQVATNIERMLATELDVEWKDYEDTINNLN